LTEDKDEKDDDEGGISTLQYPMNEYAPRLGFRLMGEGEIAEEVS